MASRAELGRYPIMITILANVICYRSRLESDNCTGLLKESFTDDIMMTKKGIPTWYSCSEEICKVSGLNINQLHKWTSKTIGKRFI